MGDGFRRANFSRSQPGNRGNALRAKDEIFRQGASQARKTQYGHHHLGCRRNDRLVFGRGFNWSVGRAVGFNQADSIRSLFGERSQFFRRKTHEFTRVGRSRTGGAKKSNPLRRFDFLWSRGNQYRRALFGGGGKDACGGGAEDGSFHSAQSVTQSVE